jgi:hypothetical protein
MSIGKGTDMKILKDIKSATSRRMKRLALTMGAVPLAVGGLATVGAQLTTQSSASAATIHLGPTTALGLNVNNYAGNNYVVPVGSGVGLSARALVAGASNAQNVTLQVYGWSPVRVVGYVCSAANQACISSAGLNGGWNIWPQYANSGSTPVWLWPNQALFANAQAYENGQWVNFSYVKVLTVPPPT